MIAVLQVVMLFVAILVKWRVAIFVYVLFLAFSPRSLSFPLGGDDSPLTFVRIATPMLLATYLILALGENRRSTPIRISFNDTAFKLLLALGVFKIAASLVNGVLPLYAAEDMLISAFAFLLFHLSATERSLRIVQNSIITAVITTAFLVAIELVMQKSVHLQFSSQVSFTEHLALRELSDRGYRAQGVFDNSLGLAEYLLYAMPVILFRYCVGACRSRFFFGIVMVLLIFSGFMTLSRGFKLFSIVTLVAFCVAYFWPRLSAGSRLISTVIIMTLLFLMASFTIAKIIALVGDAQGLYFSQIDSSEERSLLSRATQFSDVAVVIQNDLVFGVGVLQNFARELDGIHRIDNYYLRTLLEAGVTGFFLFISFVLYSLSRASKYVRKAYSEDQRAFCAMCFSLVVAFSCAKFFLSMPANNILFYSLLGLCFGLQAKRDKKDNAHSPHP